MPKQAKKLTADVLAVLVNATSVQDAATRLKVSVRTVQRLTARYWDVLRLKAVELEETQQQEAKAIERGLVINNVQMGYAELQAAFTILDTLKNQKRYLYQRVHTRKKKAKQ